MVATVSFKPTVSFAPTAKSADANVFKSALSVLNNNSKMAKMNPISVMSERMNLQSKIADTKSAPIKYVEEFKNTPSITKTESSKHVTQPNLEATIKRLQNGQLMSKHDEAKMLYTQMDNMAMQNKIMHGLI